MYWLLDTQKFAGARKTLVRRIKPFNKWWVRSILLLFMLMFLFQTIARTNWSAQEPENVIPTVRVIYRATASRSKLIQKSASKPNLLPIPTIPRVLCLSRELHTLSDLPPLIGNQRRC
jgi:hypothetical protein